jgi:hypothetical protein
MSKWRETYKVHPAADVFPMMSDEELQKLGEDIKANGLKVPLSFCWVESGTPAAHRVLIDGRNRLDAMERVGISLKPLRSGLPGSFRGKETANIVIDGDPVAHIIGLNIHRRHLTKQQQADLIVAAVKAGEKPVQVEPVSDRTVEILHPCGAPTGLFISEATADKLISESKGGRGRKNKVRAKAVAEAKKHGISEGTVRRSLAKAEGRLPDPRRIPGRPLPKPRSGKPVVGIDAARRFYLDLCADPDVDLDVEMDIIVDALREIAGKRAIAASSSQKRSSTLPQAGRSDGALDDPTCGKNGGVR